MSNNTNNQSLAFVPLKLRSNNTIFGLADTGANCSLISTATAKRLQLECTASATTKINGINGTTTYTAHTYILPLANGSKIELTSFDHLATKVYIPELSQDDIHDLNNAGIPTADLINLHRHNGTTIDILLGTNYLWKIWTEGPVHNLRSGKSVVQCNLGTFIIPSTKVPYTKADTDDNDLYAHLCSQFTVEPTTPPPTPTLEHRIPPELQAELLWALDILGLKSVDTTNEEASETENMLRQFRESVVWIDGHMHVRFPFNGKETNLHDNLPLAIRRLQTYLAKLPQHEIEEYDGILKKQLEQGIIEECPHDPPPGTNEYYIPHKTVAKDDSNTTKKRVVLDASSSQSGFCSLNDCVHPGPSILQPILGILLRARTTKFIMTSDIEKAFHQVRLHPDDRDCTRFVWLNDITKPAVNGNFKVYRFTRVPFGVACSPFLLAASIRTQLDLHPDDINALIDENLYVDNLLFTTNDEAQLIKFYTKAKKALDNMHMNLREFQTNSKTATNHIPEVDRAPQKPNKMLGHIFDAENDTITLTIATPPPGIPTKRDIQSFLAKTYDPTGLLSPLLVQLKKFCQSIWESGIAWNQPLPDDLIPIWNKLKAQFTHTTATLPRQLTFRYDYINTRLVMFADASKHTFGTAAYIHYTYPDKTHSASLLYAKSRLKPLKNGERYTIPRLELMAIAIASSAAVNIHEQLRNSFNITTVDIFSDSMIELAWLTSNKKLKCFVHNQTKLINKHITDLEHREVTTHLHHCATDVNVADYTTRGKSTTDLLSDRTWFHGPAFLRNDPTKWPPCWTTKSNVPKWALHEIDQELTSQPNDQSDNTPEHLHPHNTEPSNATNCVTLEAYTTHLTNPTESTTIHLDNLIPFGATNSLPKLIRRTRTLLAAACAFGKTPATQWTGDTLSKFAKTTTTLQDYNTRNKIALRLIIKSHYIDAANTSNHTIAPELNPVQDQHGLIRITTRLDNASHLPTSAKFPILLMKNHKLTEMIMTDIHRRNLHIGTEQLLTETRRRYWVPQGRQHARRIVHTCITCRKSNARPYRYPDIPPLPAIRVNESRPFEHIGLDYFGPLSYRGPQTQMKCWVLICTCLVTRGIHLELVTDRSTLAFILAMRRFFARRGRPQTIVLDNAKEFILGAKIFNGDIARMTNESDQFTTFLDSTDTDWRFITPLSPWKGGIYERLIAIIKKLLYANGNTATLTYSQLFTSVTEVEAIANARPIMYNGADHGDGDIIRPIDFLIPRAQLGTHNPTSPHPGRTTTTEATTREHLLALNRHLQSLWDTWTTAYLTQLTIAHHRSKAYSAQKPSVGTIVLIREELQPRHQWHIGIITELIPSADGSIRSVRLRTNQTTCLRSVNQLIPLEIEPAYTQHTATSTKANTNHTPPEPTKQPTPTKTVPTTPHPPVTTNLPYPHTHPRLRTRKYLHRAAKDNVVYRNQL